MKLDVHGWTAIAILVMAAIIIFMDWVPTALNRNIQGMSVQERLPSTLIHGAINLFFAVANLLIFKWVILVGALWFTVVLLAAIRNWWAPYFAGQHWGEITPEIYAQHYARNLTVLPRFQGHPVIPDGQHTLIHLSVLAASLLSWRSFWVA